MLRLTIALVMAAGTCLLAQGSDASSFLGTWQAKFKDKIICTIHLTPGSPIAGESRNCNINVDANGDLQEPDQDHSAESDQPILNPKVTDSTLTFEEDEGGEVVKFSFTLTGDGKAELTILDAPVKVKPIPFTRQ